MNKDQILQAITPQIYERFKSAIEIGRWPDGNALSDEQKKLCMEAIITFEHAHLTKEQHTGYVPPKPSACESLPPEQDETIKWKT